MKGKFKPNRDTVPLSTRDRYSSNNYSTFNESDAALNQTNLTRQTENGTDNPALEVSDDRASLGIFSVPITVEDGLGSYNSKTWAGRTALQTQGLTLSWHHICVDVKLNTEKKWCRKADPTQVRVKKLLKDVSGCAEPGHLLAIMGASGAGKTTLLNILTGRSLENLEVEGEVKVNGHNLGRSITRMSAYVQQDDLFIGTLTVKEHLIFQAILRMDRHLKYKERLLRVDDVLHELGLMKCADTFIGIPGRLKGISGGEMKRLAFASEVLTNPALMFCDEPTSGLDSFMAQSVVSVLKQMAAGGRTIVSTIHQPSSDTYAMFDRLILMAEGRVAFQGESKDALEYFSRLGMRCPINFNPADFYIEQMAVIPGQEEECRQRIKLICDEYEKTEKAEIANGTNGSMGDLPDKATAPTYEKYKASWCSQLRVLMWRCQIVVRRERLLTIVRLLQTLVISLIIGLIYWGQDMTQEGIMNINGALFLILTNLSFQNAMSVVTVFCEELPVFLREHWNGMYRTDTYFLSKMLAELPLFTFLPLVFICITYWWIGLYPSGYRFFIAIVVSVLVGNTACSFGYMISGLSGSAQVASSILTPLMIPLLLFGGFFLNNSSVPKWLVWLKYLSWFYYSNEALCINQWEDVDYIACTNTTATCMQNGTLVLESLHFDQENLYPDIGYLACLLVGFRIIAYVGVVLKARKRR